MWTFVRFEKKWKYDWRSNDLLERICGEVKRYRDSNAWQQQLKPVKHAVKTELDYLRKLEKILKHREGKTKIRELKYQLTRLRREVVKSKQTLQRFLPAKRAKPLWISPLGVWEMLWPKQKYKVVVKRGIALDTRLQIQLGKIFAIYLRQDDRKRHVPRVSLTTLSRLIVLVYWVSDLAQPCPENPESDVQLRIKSTGRALSVRNVQDNLIEAKLEKAQVFGRRRSKKRKKK